MSIAVRVVVNDPEEPGSSLYVGAKDGITRIMRVRGKDEGYVDLHSERTLARLTGAPNWPAMLADAVEVLAAAWADPRTRRPHEWNVAARWNATIAGIAGVGPVFDHTHPSIVLLAVHPDEDVWQQFVALAITHAGKVFAPAITAVRERHPDARRQLDLYVTRGVTDHRVTANRYLGRASQNMVGLHR